LDKLKPALDITVAEERLDRSSRARGFDEAQGGEGRGNMLGLMQSRPLLISGLVDYASTWHGSREIVSRDSEGAVHRSNYAEVGARAKRVANALDALGAGRSDRVATLAWNGWRHLEI
jgi:hypothetical protein